MAETGIPNCNNTCFMSASLQMLYSMEEFRNEIMTTDWNEYSEGNVEGLEKVKALKEIFELMDSDTEWGEQNGNNTLNDYVEGTPRRKLIEAKTELIQIINSRRSVTQIGGQHDAAEFINSLLYAINTVESMGYFYYVIQERKSYCKNGNNIYEGETKPEEQNLINLSFNGKGNIEGAIKEEEKEEDVENLDRCNELNEYIKEKENQYKPYSKITLTIPETNKYVIIALKRFEDTTNRVVDENFKVEHGLSIDGKNFSLIGAVLHEGQTRTSGHYIYQTYGNGGVLNTYNDGVMGDGETHSYYEGQKMTLNLNSYVLLYRNDGVAAPATTPTEASSSTSPEATEATEAATQSPAQSPEEAPAQSPEEAVAASTEASTTSPAAPIAQQKGKGKIERVVLNDGDRYWIYEGFGLVKPKWVHNPKSSGGNKKSRKPKDKKIRLRKTRRRKH
jgi:hypothetical protein